MITYEMILEILAPINNTFSCQPNIILNGNNFSHFNDIFDNSFYRYGATSNITNSNNNTSLHDSINYCIDSNFVHSTYDIWKISNSIHLNIIIFDFKNKYICATYMGDYFNPWRPTIYLAKYDNWYEPIVTKENKIFSFSTSKMSVLKNNILSHEIKKYNDTENPSENIIICDNFMEIMENEKFLNKETIITEEEDSINDTFITNNTFTRAKLEKMKKDELMVILNNMNLTIDMKKPTKKDIIKIICKD